MEITVRIYIIELYCYNSYCPTETSVYQTYPTVGCTGLTHTKWFALTISSLWDVYMYRHILLVCAVCYLIILAGFIRDTMLLDVLICTTRITTWKVKCTQIHEETSYFKVCEVDQQCYNGIQISFMCLIKYLYVIRLIRTGDIVESST